MAPFQANPAPRPHAYDQRVALAKQAKRVMFLSFVTLILIFPSLTKGPFNWLPIVRITTSDQVPIALGPLSLLPGLTLAVWALVRAVERPARPWRWGRPGMTIPLVGLTLLMLLSLEPAFNQRTIIIVLTLGLLWWVYLFTVNETPDLTIPLSLVILVQSSVAVAQFALQRDLGLSALGELVLDPERSGTCVLFARGERWLRAYGLSGHPNMLGPLLSILLLLIIDDIAKAQGWAQVWLTLVGSAGLLGILTTFSRGAWLAFGVATVGWLANHAWLDRSSLAHLEDLIRTRGVRLWRRYAQFILPVILGVIFLFLHRDLVVSRFLHLNTPIEARSLTDRQVDANLAVRLIRQHPWRGVGVKNYLVAVRAIEGNSRTVHNVLLLTAAELGLPGALLYIWLALSGLTRPSSPAWAPWVAMLITGLFDIALSPVNNWYAATAFGLLAAHLSFPRRATREPPGVNRPPTGATPGDAG